ncbi:MAG: glycerate kinase [bacterium]
MVIVSNAFKGSLTSIEAGHCIARGFRSAMRGVQVEVVPMADGGDGTLDAVSACVPARKVTVKVRDPLMRRIQAQYLILKDEPTAVVEMAKASGLALLKSHERNAMLTTTYGTGELIRNAIMRGCKKIIVGIGGSATNDGGAGMASALGYRFLNRDGKEVMPCGATLSKIRRIDCSDVMPEIRHVKFVIASDVKNPLLGKTGAARVYAAQKGATLEQIEFLEEWMRKFATIVKKQLVRDMAGIAGAGAAGGTGFGLMVFVGAKMQSGIELMIKMAGLEEKIKQADIVITGEGFLDAQSLQGKAPMGILRLSRKYKKPVIAFCGGVSDEALIYRYGFTAVVPIVNKPMPLEDAMKNAADLLYDAARRTAKVIKIK